MFVFVFKLVVSVNYLFTHRFLQLKEILSLAKDACLIKLKKVESINWRKSPPPPNEQKKVNCTSARMMVRGRNWGDFVADPKNTKNQHPSWTSQKSEKGYSGRLISMALFGSVVRHISSYLFLILSNMMPKHMIWGFLSGPAGRKKAPRIGQAAHQKAENKYKPVPLWETWNRPFSRIDSDRMWLILGGLVDCLWPHCGTKEP